MRTLSALAPRRAALTLATFALAACGGGEPGAPAKGAAPAPPPPQVTAVTVAPRTVAVPYELNGRLEGSREVEVRARVGGILLARRFAEGRPVERGQILFLIDPAPFKTAVRAAEAGVAEARARLSQAEREAARVEPLSAAGVVSRKALDDATSEVELARAAVLAQEAALEQAVLALSYTEVEAPISGISSRAEHSEGSLIGPGEASLLTRISQVQPIWVRFSVSDRTLLALKRGIADRSMASPATDQLTVELLLADGTAYGERGRVNFSDSLIDSATGAVDLRAEVPNRAGDLVPGQFARVRLLGVERPNAILVPQRAVQQGQAGKFVFVVGADGRAEQRPVTVGEWSGQEWIIEAGLAAGERVIVDGTLKVQPGSPVDVVAP